MTEIVSALTAPTVRESFLLAGYAGSGKTTLGLTMPRPALFIFFDPNGPASVRGFDVDHVAFLPTNQGVMPVRPVAKDGAAAKVRAKGSKYIPDIPDRFQEWFNKASTDGTFDKYQSIIVDSTSWLEAALTEMVLFDAGKWGQELDGGMYETLRSNMVKCLYPVAALNKYILICTHVKDKTNRAGDILGKQLNLVGQARQAIPSLVSNILWLEYERGKGTGFDIGARYVAITRPTDVIDNIRQVGKHHTLPVRIDMTVKDFSKPHEYGLGRLITAIESGDYPYEENGNLKSA